MVHPTHSHILVNAESAKMDCPRFCYRAVSVRDSLYVWALWGGLNPEFHYDPAANNDWFTSNIQQFTPSTSQWITRKTTGTPPLGVWAYCCSAINDQLYYFGGTSQWGLHHNNDCFHNSITHLDTISLQWRELEPTDATRPVMRRGFGGMISFEHDRGHHLLMIGGQGSKPAIHLPD